MKRTPILVVAAIAVAAVAAAGFSDAVTLKRVAQKGDTAQYKLNLDIDFGGQTVEVTAEVTEEVIKVEKNGGYVIEETTENMLMDGSEMPGGGGEVSETTYDASGLITKIDAQDMDDGAYRRASLMNFMWPTKPVDVGSEWTVKTKANSKRGTSDMSHIYKITSREKSHGHDCFKIKFENKETSGDEAWSKGVIWIDVKTGLTVLVEGEMSGVPMQDMVFDASFKLELDE